jgi:pyruvate-formate lyase-activating enzyme
MHLSDILQLRTIPASAVFIALTRRCPLRCAHCSTESLMTSEQARGDVFTRFVGSFTSANRPDLVLMTGGEPLLRPRLVEQLARTCRTVGTSSYVISGMFFARQPTISPRIMSAIDAVDHFAASVDSFHEEEVPRDAVFRTLDRVLARGKDVSIQVVGIGHRDPYVRDVVSDIRDYFDDKVPVFVGRVAPDGRARDWVATKLPRDPVTDGSNDDLAPLPCSFATWPVVAFDGTVFACCNQDVVDHRGGEHLRLGHTLKHDWAELKSRYLHSSLLRGIRLVGPVHIARHSTRFPAAECDGYCSTCAKLSAYWDDAEAEVSPLADVLHPEFEAAVTMMQRDRGAVGFASLHGVPEFADLVHLGLDP